MNIHDDRVLFRLIAIIAAIISVLLSGLATVSYGAKGGLFAVWVILSFFIFFAIVAFTIKKPFFKHNSEKFSAQFIGYFADIFMYRLFLAFIFVAWVFLSVIVWDFLDAASFLNKEIIEEPISIQDAGFGK
jgi:membrane protease YdiL (CAAX protease family)